MISEEKFKKLTQAEINERIEYMGGFSVEPLSHTRGRQFSQDDQSVQLFEDTPGSTLNGKQKIDYALIILSDRVRTKRESAVKKS